MSDFSKKLIAFLLCCVIALTLSGCVPLSLSAEDRDILEETEVQGFVGQSIGQELAATYAADKIFSLNCVSDATYSPFLTTSAWNRVVGMLVYETLVAQDESFETHPNLITSWESEDGQTWVFHIDTERTFHDGGAMTSMDAMYSMQLAMNYDGQYNTRFRYVREMYVDGDDTLVVILLRPNWRFYELMNIPCVEYDTGFRDMPPGTGPYQFSGSGRYLMLVKDHPLASKMPIDTIHLKEYTAAVDILQAFEDSYIDVVINDPNSISSLGYSSTNIIKYVNTSSMHFLGYNMMSPVFGQAVYRQLVTYAVDRDAIVSEIMKGAGTAATVPVAPQSSLYPEDFAETLEYSREGMDTAIENLGLLDVDQDGKWELGGAAYTIDFICCSESGTKVAAARSIAKKLQDAGFDVELRELGFDDYAEALRKGEFDMYYAEVRLCGDWDLTLLLGSGESLNYGGVRDGEMDELLLSFLTADGESYQHTVDTIYRYIAQNAFITPVCFEKSEVLYHRGVLSGLNPTQDNIFYGIEDWTINIE